jgi:hypothetical protein
LIKIVHAATSAPVVTILWAISIACAKELWQDLGYQRLEGRGAGSDDDEADFDGRKGEIDIVVVVL